jgi:hypothetical protein
MFRRSFCRVCILASLKQRKSCPHDRKFLSERSLVPNRAVNNHLSTLTVRCTRAATLAGAAAGAAACDWTGAPCALQQHVESACPMGEVTCKWAGCGGALARRHIGAHEQETCGFRLLTCLHAGCGHVMAAHSLERHHAADCSHAPVACPNAGCGALLAHADVATHLDVCPSVPVVCAVPGCEVHATRGSMDAHLQADIGRHIALLSGRMLASEAAAVAADSRARASEAAADARILACEQRAAAAVAAATLADTNSTALERQVSALESQLAAHTAHADGVGAASRKRHAVVSAEDVTAAPSADDAAALEARGGAAQWPALPAPRLTVATAGAETGGNEDGRLSTLMNPWEGIWDQALARTVAAAAAAACAPAVAPAARALPAPHGAPPPQRTQAVATLMVTMPPAAAPEEDGAMPVPSPMQVTPGNLAVSGAGDAGVGGGKAAEDHARAAGAWKAPTSLGSAPAAAVVLRRREAPAVSYAAMYATPRERPGSTRCAACKTQKKGTCGTPNASRLCLNRTPDMPLRKEANRRGGGGARFHPYHPAPAPSLPALPPKLPPMMLTMPWSSGVGVGAAPPASALRMPQLSLPGSVGAGAGMGVGAAPPTSAMPMPPPLGSFPPSLQSSLHKSLALLMSSQPTLFAHPPPGF